MKILYGVQGTGNGHISRAAAMSRAFKKYPNVDITWLYSGRDTDDLFDIEKGYLWRRGMTFAIENGSVSLPKTFIKNNIFRVLYDVQQLDLSKYDTVVTDFEPTVSWAARLKGCQSIGIGHQYAFKYNVPTQGENKLNQFIFRNFAPASSSVGMHWHHFEAPIVPPIVDLDSEVVGLEQVKTIPNKILVYLPFEDQLKVVGLLREIDAYEFYVYGPDLTKVDRGAIHLRPLSRTEFKKDLISSAGVICNSGFETISECLKMGIKVFTKPVAQQVEQLSNAAALEQLGYARVGTLDRQEIVNWLERDGGVHVDYPPVHEHWAEWLLQENRLPVEDLAARLWSLVTVRNV